MKTYVSYASIIENKKTHPNYNMLQHKHRACPCTDLQVCQRAKLPSTIFETILSRTNPWNRVIGTPMYNDIAVSKRVDRAIIKRIIFPFSSVIDYSVSIIQFLVFIVWHLHYVLHSNSPWKGLCGKLFLPQDNYHQNNPFINKSPIFCLAPRSAFLHEQMKMTTSTREQQQSKSRIQECLFSIPSYQPSLVQLTKAVAYLELECLSIHTA